MASGKPEGKKAKKPHPFRNGLLIGLIVGIFLGWLIPVPGWFDPARTAVQETVKQEKTKVLQKVGEGTIKAGETLKKQAK
jgi:hypothetical protein